jgi:hypothetical protein
MGVARLFGGAERASGFGNAAFEAVFVQFLREDDKLVLSPLALGDGGVPLLVVGRWLMRLVRGLGTLIVALGLPFSLRLLVSKVARGIEDDMRREEKWWLYLSMMDWSDLIHLLGTRSMPVPEERDSPTFLPATPSSPFIP